MKKLSKVVISTAIVGASLATSTFALANVKNANVVDFALKLNNREVKLENADIVAIDGRTYLPLAALCQQLLGMTVDWNAETTTVEMWNITKPTDRGSHESPVPLGVAVTGEFYNKTDKKYIPYNVSVTEVVRGNQAEEWIREQYVDLNEYPVLEEVVREKGESGDKYKARVEKAKKAYETAVEKYEAKYNTYLEGLRQDPTREFLRAKVRIDIMQANSEFSYKTTLKDLIPYSGNVIVDGLQRQYVQYSVKEPKMRDEVNYSGRELLTNGVYEGYYIIPVYKNDMTPRIMYKDGQYLALYKN